MKRALRVQLPPCCPHSADCSPITVLSPLFSTNHFHNSFFSCCPSLLSLGYAQPTISFVTIGVPLFSHLGGPKCPSHSRTYTPPTRQPSDVFPALKTEVKSSSPCTLQVVVYSDKDDRAASGQTQIMETGAKSVTKVSVKNVVSLWGHAANFSANPISTGGLLGFSFQSQPGTGLI